MCLGRMARSKHGQCQGSWISFEPFVLALGSTAYPSLSSPSRNPSVGLSKVMLPGGIGAVAGLMRLLIEHKRSDQQSETSYKPYAGSGDGDRLIDHLPMYAT